MRRKKLHNVRKGFIDAHVEKEGFTYEAVLVGDTSDMNILYYAFMLLGC